MAVYRLSASRELISSNLIETLKYTFKSLNTAGTLLKKSSYVYFYIKEIFCNYLCISKYLHFYKFVYIIIQSSCDLTCFLGGKTWVSLQVLTPFHFLYMTSDSFGQLFVVVSFLLAEYRHDMCRSSLPTGTHNWSNRRPSHYCCVICSHTGVQHSGIAVCYIQQGPI